MIRKLKFILALLSVLAVSSSAQAVTVTHSTAGVLVNHNFESDTPGSLPAASPWGEVMQNRSAGSYVEVLDVASPYVPGPNEGENYLLVERITDGMSATASALFATQTIGTGKFFTLNFALYRAGESGVGINWAPQGQSSSAGRINVFPDGQVYRYYGDTAIPLGLTSQSYTWENWQIVFNPIPPNGTPKVSVSINGQSSGLQDADAPFTSYDRVEFSAHPFSKFYIDADIPPPPLPPTVAYYRFEDSGGTTADSSGNGHTATVNGALRIGDVPVNPVPQNGLTNTQSMEFTVDSVVAPAAVDAGAGDFTLELFYKHRDDFNNYEVIAGKKVSGAPPSMGGTGDKGWELLIDRPSGNFYRLNAVVGAGPGQVTQIFGNYDLAFETWYHFALVRSGDNLNLYVDGTSIASATGMAGLDFSNLSTPFVMGTDNDLNSDFLRWGVIDEVRLSRVALTPSQFLRANPSGSGGVVPEPATLSLLVGGVMLLALRRRRVRPAVLVVLAMAMMLPASMSRTACALDGAYNIAPVTYYDPTTMQTSPFFAIGWYDAFQSVPSYIPLELSNTGANTRLRFSGGLPTSTAAELAVLDQLDALGMKEVFNFSNDLVMSADPVATITTWVNALKNHPALLGWQVGDEGQDAAKFGDAVAAIRAADPNHQIWQVFEDRATTGDGGVLDMMTGDTPGNPTRHTDVLNSAHYPFTDGSGQFPAAADTLLNLTNSRADDATANDWAGNLTTHQAFGDIGNSPQRVPSYAEHRWDVFSSLASSGARGSFNWIYGSNGFDNTNEWLHFRDDVAAPVMYELKRLTEAMETGYDVGTVTTNHDAPEGGAGFNEVSHLLSFDNDDDIYYLIVTNNESNTNSVTVTLSNLPQPLSSLIAQVYDPTTCANPGGCEADPGGNVTLTNLGGGSYQFTESFGSREVIVYELLAAATLDGDYNGDGVVDAADYVVWRKNPAGFGGPAGYGVWVENFGRTLMGSGGGSGSALASSQSDSAVPEPSGILLLCVGGLAWLGLKRR